MQKSKPSQGPHLAASYTTPAAYFSYIQKVKYADYVINTSGDLAGTRSQVAEVNSKLRELAASTSGKRRS